MVAAMRADGVHVRPAPGVLRAYAQPAWNRMLAELKEGCCCFVRVLPLGNRYRSSCDMGMINPPSGARQAGQLGSPRKATNDTMPRVRSLQQAASRAAVSRSLLDTVTSAAHHAAGSRGRAAIQQEQQQQQTDAAPVSARAKALLRQCLNALVTDPEAACMGGDDLCCSGCGGNSQLVDSLCAFCLHSNAARRCFVAHGGLEALQLACGDRRPEKTRLAALQVLQCLCSTQLGQHMVAAQRPELLRAVCQLADDADEDREALQHAALVVLTGWADDDESDSPILAWLTKQPPQQQQQQQQEGATPREGAPVHRAPSWASEQHPPPAGAPAERHDDLRDDGSLSGGEDAPPQALAHPQATPMVFGGGGGDERSSAHANGGDGGGVGGAQAHTGGPHVRGPAPPEPLLLGIAARALQHPTLATRKAGAQLFAVAAARAPAGGAFRAAASSRLAAMARRALRVLRHERRAMAAPRFAAFAATVATTPAQHAAMLLDPAAFLRHQERSAAQRRACHALLHVCCELAAVGPSLSAPNPAVLPPPVLALEQRPPAGAPGHHPQQQQDQQQQGGTALLAAAVHDALPALLEVLECAWRVESAAPAAPASTGPDAQQHHQQQQVQVQELLLPPSAQPFSFLQDHQSRELALDTLVVVLRQPGMLACLGRGLAAAEERQQQARGGADGSVHGGGATPAPPAANGTSAARPHSPQQQEEEDHAMDGEGGGGGGMDAEAAERLALERLTRLVHALLAQQSAGHVRAAITVLGHVRFDHVPSGAAAATAAAVGPAQGGGGGGEEGGGGGVAAQWVQLLSTLFDVAWQSEVQAAAPHHPLSPAKHHLSDGEGDAPPRGAQGAAAAAEEGGAGRSTENGEGRRGGGGGAAAGALVGSGSVNMDTSSQQQQQQQQQQEEGGGGGGRRAQGGGVVAALTPLRFGSEVGLGYRVLVQVRVGEGERADAMQAPALSRAAHELAPASNRVLSPRTAVCRRAPPRAHLAAGVPGVALHAGRRQPRAAGAAGAQRLPGARAAGRRLAPQAPGGVGRAQAAGPPGAPQGRAGARAGGLGAGAGAGRAGGGHVGRLGRVERLWRRRGGRRGAAGAAGLAHGGGGGGAVDAGRGGGPGEGGGGGRVGRGGGRWRGAAPSDGGGEL